MGATSFSFKERGTSLQNAYKNAYDEAREEHGTDSYNGTISTTRGVIDLTSKFKASGKSLNDFINDNIYKADKWGDCFGICVKQAKANTNKIKSVVKHEVFKGTRKWELVYVVTKRFSDTEIGAKDNKADAVKLAREHTEKTRESTSIHIERRLKGSSSRVAVIEYKGSTNEEMGEYVLFGVAAC
jgi:hypothetical protein